MKKVNELMRGDSRCGGGRAFDPSSTAEKVPYMLHVFYATRGF
jgi:hypothetical protein